MNLCFEISQRQKYWCVNIYTLSKQDQNQRSYLEECQYQKIQDWCYLTFSRSNTNHRVRRMSYADFWFLNKTDLDWFLLRWTEVDSNSI
jgi:hypothetical protein